MTTCPDWCTEHHDHREVMFGEADHARAFLHDLGGASVFLHRLDRDGEQGQVRVVVDPGSDHYLDVAQARRVALAVLAACEQA